LIFSEEESKTQSKSIIKPEDKQLEDMASEAFDEAEQTRTVCLGFKLF
jgi:hypothetical protein